MATTYNNCQMGIVDASGNLSVIYPQTKASLVSCDSGNYGGSSAVTNVQSALNNLSTALGNYLPLAGGTMTGTIITPSNDDKGLEPKTDNYGQVGSTSKRYYRGYMNTVYSNTIYLGNSSSTSGRIIMFNKKSSNTGTLSSSTLTVNRTWALPNKDGTLALTSEIPSIPSVGSMNTVTIVGNNYYRLNGNNGVHYGYYKYGPLCIALLNIWCGTPISDVSQKIGSGFPKPLIQNTVGALGSQASDKGGGFASIDDSGNLMVCGCSANTYNYGYLIYPWTI